MTMVMVGKQPLLASGPSQSTRGRGQLLCGLHQQNAFCHSRRAGCWHRTSGWEQPLLSVIMLGFSGALAWDDLTALFWEVCVCVCAHSLGVGVQWLICGELSASRNNILIGRWPPGNCGGHGNSGVGRHVVCKEGQPSMWQKRTRLLLPPPL